MSFISMALLHRKRKQQLGVGHQAVVQPAIKRLRVVTKDYPMAPKPRPVAPSPPSPEGDFLLNIC